MDLNDELNAAAADRAAVKLTEAVNDLRAVAAEEERAHAVAYLRRFATDRHAGGMADEYSATIAHAVGILADAIEAGEHA